MPVHHRVRAPAARARAALLVAVLGAGLLVPGAGPAAARLPRFVAPVDAPILDGYRPPDTPYGPGNRGWQYDTEPGTTVVAAGEGVVSFAGPVGGGLHVTVAHGGGLRTSYSELATVTVQAGQRVSAGTPVATSGDTLHFGVRIGDRYVDPAVLFRAGALVERARLVPLPRPR